MLPWQPKTWGALLSATSKPLNPPLASIFGCASTELSDAERAFFKDASPLGFILFARNIDHPDQVKALVADMRDCVGRNAPILIDQEGGRVQRLRPPHWRSAPPLRQFGELFAIDPERAKQALRLNMRAIGAELADLGIDVDCAPCLDVPVPGAHDVIGNRALSEDTKVVVALSEAACQGLMDVGVVPVIKHLPGHGRAGVDSHEQLPQVESEHSALADHDLPPFKAVAQLPVAAMTAHVVYTAHDADQPATLSAKVIKEIIRQDIGFDGLLMSDDLGMKALSGSFKARAEASLAAGCDVALHCSGDWTEMQDVAAGCTALSDHAVSSMERLDAYRGKARVDTDLKDVSFEVASLMQEPV